jgi:hypothetical protein
MIRRPAALSAVALTAVLAVAGCGSSSTTSGSSSSQSSAFRKCLQQHGVSLPSGAGHFPGAGSTASPRPRPTGSRSSSFQQVIKDCGGTGGFGGAGSGG